MIDRRRMRVLKSVYNEIAEGDYRFCGRFAWDIYNGAFEGENFETWQEHPNLKLPRNREDAVGILKLGMEHGYADAYSYMGILYLRGEVVPKDVNKYIELTKKAADMGDFSAQYNLGQDYFYGDIIPKNDDMAFEYTKKATESEYSREAWKNLGIFYWNGVGTEKSFSKAMHALFEAWRRDSKEGTSIYHGICDTGIREIVGEIICTPQKLGWEGRPENVQDYKNESLRNHIFRFFNKDLPISGGRGTSKEDAVIVNCNNDSFGTSIVREVTRTFVEEFGGDFESQSCVHDDGKVYDIMTIIENGVSTDYWFDITKSYGKYGHSWEE